MSGIDLNALEKEARQEFEAEKSQGAGYAGGLMEVDVMEDDYDYYESQASRQDRMKSRAKPFCRLPFNPILIQGTRKHGGPQFREEAGDVLATLAGYLNRDIKKINRLSSAVSAQKHIDDKHLGKRFSIQEQDLDDNIATPDNVVVYDKKKERNFFSRWLYKSCRIWRPRAQIQKKLEKQYYMDVNNLERAALAAKLKQQSINGGPYMKWLSITRPHKVREIKNYSFKAFTTKAKKVIDQNGGAQLPMTTKQRIMTSAWNSVLIILVVNILERQDGKIDIYNRSNKVHVQKGDYQYLPLSKILYKKELHTAITQLYQAEDVDARIKKSLGQAIQYYSQILTYRQQSINGFNLDKYKFQ
ncbi:MAG: hypothetical protein EZS28_007943 [Streblomastix strix]|uniref:Uncharacterized protein n=1 Tax=Streblomastix strix TaxID=222440 RepID=A0A5J4WR33_9EUKA|nr:MAG: hypothetical protein EZS28_007943 [Streblomastix strix]